MSKQSRIFLTRSRVFAIFPSDQVYSPEWGFYIGFPFRDSAALTGIIRRAKGVLAVADDYFTSRDPEFLAVANGMLRLKDRVLLPFSPTYKCRYKLAIEYDPVAFAPQFMKTLLESALDRGDIYLIQRWSGLALIGKNLCQKILLLTGTPGGGKSTLVSVLTGILGQENVGTLRTDLLADRFEIGRLLGKSLLYGADVPEDFLTQKSASILKSLTGGDLITAEFKNSNESPQIKCQFNIIVTSNSRLSVYLEGDSDAWRRRLCIIKYERPKPAIAIPNFAEQIIKEEGAGVLNFMLDGLDVLSGANWNFQLNDKQQQRVDDLLLESESHRVFVRKCLVKDTSAPGITKNEVYSAYIEFCETKGWQPMIRHRFGKLAPEAIAQQFGLIVRNDIKTLDGKQNDGWKYLRLKTESDGGV